MPPLGRWVTSAFVLFASASLAGPAGPVTWTGTAQMATGGWGRMTRLQDGSWIGVSTDFPSDAPSRLRIYKSWNDSGTWTRIAEVSDGRTNDNGELVQLPNGTVLLTGRSLIGGSSYRLPVYRSIDGGTNWTYLSNIDASEGLGTRGLWEPDFGVLGDGRLIVTYSNEKHDGYAQVISQRISTDNGASWGVETWAVSQPGGGALRPGMSQMARLANGRYILVYEVCNIGNCDVHFKTSTDGVTWGGGIGTRIPCQHVGPFVTVAQDGRVFVTSAENQVSWSEDSGSSWMKIDPPAWNIGPSLSWPAIYQTRPDELAVMAVVNGVRLRYGTLLARQVWPTVFRDDFNDGDDRNWSRYGGGFAFVSSTYALPNEGTYGKALVGDPFWRDGTLEADVMLTSPGNAGVVFRMRNADYTGADAGFGYYAGLDSDGFLIVGSQDGGWHEMSRTNLPVALNRWYHLSVVLNGNLMVVGVDNTPRLTNSASAFPRGQVGVRAFQCNAQFDNVTFSNASPAFVGTGTGLRADYYADTNLTDLTFTRRDAMVDFNWAGAPVPEGAQGGFGVRWNGQVQTQFSEVYSFYVGHDGGTRLWVNDTLLLGGWNESYVVRTAQIPLLAGAKYDLTLEYYNDSPPARVRLAWSSASTGWSIIPATQLYLHPPGPSTVTALPVTNGQFYLRVNGDFGPNYSVQSSTNLLDWQTVFTTNSPMLPFVWDERALSDRRFYRALLSP